MSQVQFSQNFQDFLIPTENGKSLCSVTNPQGEALHWSYSLGALPTNHVVVIGLGAGFHVAALADTYPDLRITVIDNRDSLVPIFKAQFADIQDRVEVMIAQESRDLLQSDIYQEIVRKQCFVLSFVECWGQQDDIFSGFFAHATGRTVESVRYHFAEMGMNMKSFYYEGGPLLSLTEMLPAIEASDLDAESKQVFQLLGELAHS